MCLKRRKEIKKRPGLAQFLKKETGLENINLATENGKNTTVCKRLDKSVPVSSMQTVQGSPSTSVQRLSRKTTSRPWVGAKDLAL